MEVLEIKQEEVEAEEVVELSSELLDQVGGGIIIVGL